MGRCLSPWEEIQVFYGLVIEVFNFGEIFLQFSLISAFRKRTVNKIFFYFLLLIGLEHGNAKSPIQNFVASKNRKAQDRSRVHNGVGLDQVGQGRPNPHPRLSLHSPRSLKFGFKQDPFTDQDPIGWRTRGSDNDQPVMCDRKSCRTTNELGKVEVWVKLGKAHKKSCRGTSELGKAYVWGAQI